MFDSSYQGLKRALEKEKQIYLSPSLKQRILDRIKHTQKTQMWKFVKAMRYTAYFKAKNKRSIIGVLLGLFWQRRMNVLGERIGMFMDYNTFDEGATFYHPTVYACGNIGKNCRLHGNNMIGRNSLGGTDVPTIGDNVRFCYGAQAFGDIYIADDVTIAAGSIVLKSCYEKGVTLAGVPAKIIKRPE